MTNLHDELARIAERAPDIDVNGLWERGRRARTHDRVVAGVVLAAVLALVAGLGSLVVAPQRVLPPADGPDTSGVPSRIWPVPERFLRWGEESAGWSADVAETDLAIGRAATAMAIGTFDEGPAVITADGGYHPLVLPGWVGTEPINSTISHDARLALSPDGRSLAYAWWDPTAPVDGPMPAGVRVVDLESGDLRTVALHAGQGVMVLRLSWSADSRWVAWDGLAMRSWTRHSTGGGSTVAGVIGPGAQRSRPVDGHPLAIGTDGHPVVLVRGDRLVAGGRRVDGRRISLATQGAALSHDGRTAVLEPPWPVRRVEVLDVPTGQRRLFPLAADTYPEGALVQPLGWLDDTRAVVLLTPTYGVERHSGWGSRGHLLAVLDTRRSGSSAWRVVGTADVGVPRDLTVAVDLMAGTHATVDHPAPAWPWSDGRLAATAATVLAATALLLAAAYVVRRRRRTR